jgi:DNA-binding NarL/FixJ family response regulator
VVAMSVQGGLAGTALAAGAAAFVEKDGSPDAIIDALRRAGPPGGPADVPPLGEMT